MNKKSMIALSLAIVIAIVALPACAPRQANDSKQDEQYTDSSGNQPTWSIDSDCSTCHSSQAHGDSTLGALHLTSELSCVACHAEAEMIDIHGKYGDSGRTPLKLRYSKIKNEGCLSSTCHQSIEALAESTAEIGVVDNNGTAKNPHEMMLENSHKEIECVSCHSIHKDEEALEAAQLTCFGCHHARVFECGTCHE